MTTEKATPPGIALDNEALAWRFKFKGHRFWQTTGDRDVIASMAGSSNIEIVPLYEAAPTPHEQEARAASEVDEETERTSAMDRAFPITSNPHASVQQRTMQNRVAFGLGFDARASLSRLDWRQGYADALDIHELRPAQAGMLPVAQTDAARDVLAERCRQVEQEGGDK